MLPVEPESARHSHRQLRRILVVEDEALIRETVKEALIQEGYEVLTVSDGQAALNFILQSQERDLKSLPIDLIVLDIMLPKLSGLDICRFIRNKGIKVPVMMLSARTTETDRVVGLEVGADDYLCKPFGLKEFVARCRTLLRNCKFQSYQDSVLHLGEVVLSPDEHRVTLRGKEVALSPKEFQILEVLMRYRDRIWSRQQLIHQIWGKDFLGDSKTVDVHIRWLREKLETDPSNPKYIITMRGFGYRCGCREIQSTQVETLNKKTSY